MKNLSFCALLSLLPGFVNIQTYYLFPHCFPVQATYGALVVWCVVCLIVWFFSFLMALAMPSCWLNLPWTFGGGGCLTKLLLLPSKVGVAEVARREVLQ